MYRALPGLWGSSLCISFGEYLSVNTVSSKKKLFRA